MRSASDDFAYVTNATREVRVLRYGHVVTVLRGRAADRFLAEVVAGDAQRVMARVTGNYKRGNERLAGRHPRNRTR
jgi:hypothetical protein